MFSEDGSSFTDERTHTSGEAVEKQLQDGAPSPAHPLGVCVCVTYCLDQSVITAEAHVVFAGAIQQTHNAAELSGIIHALQFFNPLEQVPRGSRAFIFFDSQHAADVCLGSVQPRTNVRVAGSSQQLFLQVQLRVSLTLRHIYGHKRNVGNVCANHAAALGALGFVSARWQSLRFDTSNLARKCHDLIDIQHRLRDARGEHTPLQKRPCFVVAPWSTLCLIVSSSWLFLVSPVVFRLLA